MTAAAILGFNLLTTSNEMIGSGKLGSLQVSLMGWVRTTVPPYSTSTNGDATDNN